VIVTVVVVVTVTMSLFAVRSRTLRGGRRVGGFSLSATGDEEEASKRGGDPSEEALVHAFILAHLASWFSSPPELRHLRTEAGHDDVRPKQDVPPGEAP